MRICKCDELKQEVGGGGERERKKVGIVDRGGQANRQAAAKGSLWVDGYRILLLHSACNAVVGR